MCKKGDNIKKKIKILLAFRAAAKKKQIIDHLPIWHYFNLGVQYLNSFRSGPKQLPSRPCHFLPLLRSKLMAIIPGLKCGSFLSQS